MNVGASRLSWPSTLEGRARLSLDRLPTTSKFLFRSTHPSHSSQHSLLQKRNEPKPKSREPNFQGTLMMNQTSTTIRDGHWANFCSGAPYSLSKFSKAPLKPFRETVQQIWFLELLQFFGISTKIWNLVSKVACSAVSLKTSLFEENIHFCSGSQSDNLANVVKFHFLISDDESICILSDILNPVSGDNRSCGAIVKASANHWSLIIWERITCFQKEWVSLIRRNWLREQPGMVSGWVDIHRNCLVPLHQGLQGTKFDITQHWDISCF